VSAPALAAADRAPHGPGPRRDPTRLARLVLADVLERTRRPGYLVTLLAMVWIGQHMLPPSGASYRTFEMDEFYRPAYGAAWVGSLTALLTGLWFMFVGFYLVKGSVERDRRTGVGQILAATRIPSLTYLAARWLGNLAVLASQALVVALVAIVQQQLLGEDRRVDLAATLLPFVAITLPIAMLVAAAAVLFDCVRWLKGGFGNIVWFVLIGGLLAAGVPDDPHAAPWRDLTGSRVLVADVRRVMIAAHPDAASRPPSLSMGVNMNPQFRTRRSVTFAWPGLRWTVQAAASRLPWIVLPLLIVLGAVIPFDRFDTAARGATRPPWRAPWQRAKPEAAPAHTGGATLAPAAKRFSFAAIVRAELALLLREPSRWWYTGVLAGLVAELAAPLPAVRDVVLPLVTIWPALLWSSLGHREQRCDTGAVLFSCPRPVARLLPAAWAAGALVMVLAGAPALVRMALASELAYAGGWLLGAAFVPALALALGVWTGSAKFFEVLYLFLWYVGPMHHVALFDYTGVSAPRTAALWLAYAAATVALMALAWIGRSRQVRG
jgi:hypothetical protein